MKIVCDSCAAKYSIADEKVAGRVFKIRCKKCGAAIVVRGDQGAAEAAPAAAAAGFDYGGEAVWHAVVDGEQQGPFAPSQLGSMISAGTLGWDAYVWREGFEDWKPAQDIEELVQAIMNPGGAPAAGGAEDPFTDAPTMASPSPAEAKSAAPKGAKRDAGADLFAQSEASPFGGGGGEDDDVVASAASPRVSSAQAMTGSRNENSVLFSLSNLQALATGSPGGGGGGGGSSSSPSSSSGRGASSPAPKAGMAMGEGSGLIDIRALASATGLTGGGGSSGPSMGSAPAKIDDLLSIGSPSVGLGSALGAPVIIPEKKESSGAGGSTMILAAAILAVALLGGAGIFAYVTVNAAPDPAATAPATVAAIAPGATAAPPPTAATVTPAVPATPATPEAPATPATPASPSTPSSSGSSSRRGHGSSSSSSSTASAPTAPSTPSTTPRSSADRSIDDLLGDALGPSARRPAPSATTTPAPSGGSDDSSLAATPSRSDVTTAMGRVQGAVTACGAGEHGVATVQIAVAGATGRVSNATVGGTFAGTPVGSCIARAVRTASFPHFRNPTFSFTFPFRI